MVNGLGQRTSGIPPCISSWTSVFTKTPNCLVARNLFRMHVSRHMHCINEGINECMKCMSEGVNACMNECINQCMNQCMNAWINACMNERMNECINEWMHGWINQLMHEWMHVDRITTDVASSKRVVCWTSVLVTSHWSNSSIRSRGWREAASVRA